MEKIILFISYVMKKKIERKKDLDKEDEAKFVKELETWDVSNSKNSYLNQQLFFSINRRELTKYKIIKDVNFAKLYQAGSDA